MSNSSKFDLYRKEQLEKGPKTKNKKVYHEKMDNFFVVNHRKINLALLEAFNNIAFHALDTIKVRNQAKNIVEDVAHYTRNRVFEKPLISGVVSAGIGSYLSAYLFVFLHEKSIFWLFDKNNKTRPEFFNSLTWKGKIITSYIFSDIFKLAVFLPFEARKQRIQMAQYKVPLLEMLKYSWRAFPPLLLRDLIFRTVTIGSFLNNLNLEHTPQLKYKMEDIRDYIKMKEDAGERVRYNYFLDYSKISIYSTVQQVFLNLIFSTVLGTVISQPFDTIGTKMLTQTRLKYRGLFQSYKLIMKEESFKKLVFSGLSFRISFNLLSGTLVMFSYEKLNAIIVSQYDQ